MMSRILKIPEFRRIETDSSVHIERPDINANARDTMSKPTTCHGDRTPLVQVCVARFDCAQLRRGGGGGAAGGPRRTAEGAR